MLVMGISGGADLINESRYFWNPHYWHDAEAVLVEDGKVVFAIEEERLNRIKHTNKLPVRAIRACLASRGAQLKDIDLFAYYEMNTESWLKRVLLDDPRETCPIKRELFLQQSFSRGLGNQGEPPNVAIVIHHSRHA